ncbi:MAG: D-Ala-D-Ala carboxypeptidase family metallohydrolase [Candidatus Margulisiibacteriota bacterium]
MSESKGQPKKTNANSRRRRNHSNQDSNRKQRRHQFSRNKPNLNLKRQKNSKWNKYRLSEHFVKRDFDSRKKDCSCAGSLRISLGLVGIIEALRAEVNERIDILTGYYCPECRERQYGIKRDFHHMGVAADIRVKGMSLTKLFQIAETFPEIKGIGLNLDEGHVHIDTRKEDERECWIEKDNEWIKLTPENRLEYFTLVPSEPVDSETSDDDQPED